MHPSFCVASFCCMPWRCGLVVASSATIGKEIVGYHLLMGPADYRKIGSWDRCYDFLNIFVEKFSEKIGVFGSKQS
jgi:hypothetical protein